MNLLTLSSMLLLTAGAIGLVCVELIRPSDPRAARFALLHRSPRRRRPATVHLWSGIFVALLGAGVLLLPGRH